ncbi:MAG: SIMPL domain-containing protein [Bacteroides sp.]|nr:SIMPL domain-containing protein [Bacteroides sp.]MCM1413794.1 SIMPL domain-containing protein [Bacteroides sp.]MCM1472187.1 SIMPL domain-containing protein [Bacteroides sp.]
MKTSYVIPAALIAVGLLLLGLCIRSGIMSVTSSQRTVEVKGLATREVKADLVTWPIVFKQVGNELPQVYAAVSNTNDRIVAFLKQNGLTDKEISIGAPTMTDLTTDRYNTNPVPFNYSVESVVTVNSTQVDKVHDLILRQGELMQQGIAISSDYSNPITYDYTGLNNIKPEMIAEATKNAREAANKFAEDSDSKLGKIKTASQGQFSINDRDQYTPYIKDVRVVTTLTYYLED